MYTSYMIELSVKIVGRVHGVFFRQSTKDRADSLGVVGWVKNCSDGTVEALFQASIHEIEEMKAFVAVGPNQAQVDKVVILHQKDCTKSLEGFTILYE